MVDHRMYGDLARWWPLVSPPAEYAEEAAFFSAIIERSGAENVLELGSGGGHNAFHMKQRFPITLVDKSPQMLAVSQALNPECEHLEGDMRSLRINREFDAVFIHDAVAYMLTADDLRRAIETAFVHCRPGGVALFVPDDTLEDYEPDTDVGGSSTPDGSGVRYLEWWHDVDQRGIARIDYVFLLREASGEIEIVHDVHHNGVFSSQTWLELLEAGGFRPEVIVEVTSEDRRGRKLFLAHKP